MDLLISGVLSLGSVAFFLRLARSLEREPRIAVSSYGVPDAIFALLLVAWFVINIIGSYGQKLVVNADMLVVNVVFALLLLICLASFLIVRSLNPIKLFGLDFHALRRGLPAALIGLAVALPVIYFIHALSFYFLGKPEPQPLVQFLVNTTSWNDRLLLILTAVVVAPVSEEVIFRGYIYGVARRYAGRWWALAVSAVIFAAIHAHLPSLGGLLVLAVALTFIYEYTTSLWAPIFAHAAFNGLTVAATLVWPDILK